MNTLKIITTGIIRDTHILLWCRWTCVMLTLLFGCISASYAQTCVPPSMGVPPSYQPPHWWDNSPPQPVYYQKLNDPRWQGAAAISYTDGTQEKMTFLALQDSTHLYLSWRYQGMSLGVVGQNVLYVGLEPAGGGNPIIVRTSLTTTSTTEAGYSGAIDPNAFELNTSTSLLGSDISDPPWVDDSTRVWITPTSYAVQMRIPKSAINISSGTFKLWYELLAGSPSDPLVRFVWPRTGAEIVSTTMSTPPFDTVMQFPLPNALTTPWESFKLSTGPSDMSCPAQGISLDQDKIATKNPNANEILYKLSPDPKPENVLFARPTNNSGVSIPAGKLKATFRIANWGSQPNFEDWEVGVPIDQLWAKVPCVGADVNGAVETVGDIGIGATAPESSELRCRWTLTDAEILPFSTGARNSHSCLLVEMSDTMTPGLVYRNRSMWNNFDVRQASVIEDSAEISLKGLPGGSRDVYVYVDALNMPSKIPPKTDGQTDGRALSGAARELLVGISQGKIRAAELSGMISRGQVTNAQLDEFLPTYRVSVFHDTGKTLTIGGAKRPILNPQGSFGYRITHAGELNGWRHQLGFEHGYTVDELSPGFFRIKQVPKNGVIKVSTRVEAVETPTPPCQCGTICAKQALNDSDAISGSLILVGTLGAGGFAFLRRRRKQESSGLDERAED